MNCRRIATFLVVLLVHLVSYGAAVQSSPGGGKEEGGTVIIDSDIPGGNNRRLQRSRPVPVPPFAGHIGCKSIRSYYGPGGKYHEYLKQYIESNYDRALSCRRNAVKPFNVVCQVGESGKSIVKGKVYLRLDDSCQVEIRYNFGGGTGYYLIVKGAVRYDSSRKLVCVSGLRAQELKIRKTTRLREKKLRDELDRKIYHRLDGCLAPAASINQFDVCREPLDTGEPCKALLTI